MRIKKYLPTDILKPFIKEYLFIESELGMQNTILPGTSVIMAFRLRGKTTDVLKENGIHPQAAITGLARTVRLIKYAPNTSVMLASFQEGGASAFFNDILYEINGQSISLENVMNKNSLFRLEDRLFGAKNHQERIHILENFFIDKLNDNQLNPRISQAIHFIRSSNGRMNIKELASSVCYSMDAFEKQFRKTTGTTPKQFSNIIRFKNAISNYSEASNLTDLAMLSGYYDQAHFIKTFKSYAGKTPKQFFLNPVFW